MNSWKEKTINDLYDVHNGLSKSRNYFGNGYPFLSFSTVFNNYFIPDELRDYVQTTEKERVNYSIRRGDVFVTRTSETTDELGMSCVALKDYPNATYNGFTKRLRPKTNELLPEYIGYYFRTHSFRGKFKAFSTMTTRASLKNEDLLSLSVFFPSMEKQRRIASVLLLYDKLIENNQKQIKLLEEAAQRLYKEWFVDFRFPRHETTPIVDGLPEGWNYAALSEIADVVMGQSPKSEYYNNQKQGLPFHQGVGSYGERFVIDNIYSTSYTRIAQANSILFSVRAPVGRLNISKKQVVIGRGLASIIHKRGFQSFLFYQLKDMFYKDNLVGNGSIFASISKNELMQLKLVVPSSELMKKYNDIISIVDKKIENMDNQMNLAQEARDRLLPKLMNGEIEV